MQLIQSVFIGACLCAFSSSIAAASSLQLADLHLVESNPGNNLTQPTILKIELFKKGVFLRSCYGAHFSPSEFAIYWILPAECVDQTKYDMVEVKHGYKDRSRSTFYLKDIWIRIHPSYDGTTKAHNIAFVALRYPIFLEAEEGTIKVQLPSSTENFDGKTLELYAYKDKSTDTSDSKGTELLHCVKTKIISSVWCKILYPFSPIKNYHLCLSGTFGKGLSKNVGAPLIARDGESFKLVGLATVIRSMANIMSFPIEILRIQPYLEWINSVSGEHFK